MESVSNARRDKRRTFLSAIGVVAAVMVLAPPMVQAATQKVNVVKSKVLTVKGTVGVSQLNGTNTAADSNHGALPGEAMSKTINVRSLAAGEGFYGTGVCEAATDPDENNDTSSDNRVIVPANPPGEPDNVVSGILIGATVANPATVTVSAPTLSGTPIIALRTTAEEPTKFIGLASGLRASPSRLVFNCPAGAGGSYVVIGN